MHFLAILSSHLMQLKVLARLQRFKKPFLGLFDYIVSLQYWDVLLHSGYIVFRDRFLAPLGFAAVNGKGHVNDITISKFYFALKISVSVIPLRISFLMVSKRDFRTRTLL